MCGFMETFPLLHLQVMCRTEEDENGRPQRKCERVRKKLRQRLGEPPEEVETTREEIDGARAGDIEMPGMFSGPGDAEGESLFPPGSQMGAPLMSALGDILGMFREFERHMERGFPGVLDTPPREGVAPGSGRGGEEGSWLPFGLFRRRRDDDGGRRDASLASSVARNYREV